MPVKGVRGRLPEGPGRVAADNELWRMVPECVREANMAPDFHDYHGNFTAQIFERLFEDVCATLEED